MQNNVTHRSLRPHGTRNREKEKERENEIERRNKQTRQRRRSQFTVENGGDLPQREETRGRSRRVNKEGERRFPKARQSESTNDVLHGERGGWRLHDARGAPWRHDVSTAFATRADVTITARVSPGAREQHARDHAAVGWPCHSDSRPAASPSPGLAAPALGRVITHTTQSGPWGRRVLEPAQNLRKLHCAARRQLGYAQTSRSALAEEGSTCVLLFFFFSFTCRISTFSFFCRAACVSRVHHPARIWTRTRRLSHRRPRPSSNT